MNAILAAELGGVERRLAELESQSTLSHENANYSFDTIVALRARNADLEERLAAQESHSALLHRNYDWLLEAIMLLRQQNTDRGCNDASMFDICVMLAFALGVLLAGEMSLTLWCLSVCVAGRMIQLLHPQIMADLAVMKDWVVTSWTAARAEEARSYAAVTNLW